MTANSDTQQAGPAVTGGAPRRSQANAIFAKLGAARKRYAALIPDLEEGDKVALRFTQRDLRDNVNQNRAQLALDHLVLLWWNSRRERVATGYVKYPDLREAVSKDNERKSWLFWLDHKPFTVKPEGSAADKARAAYDGLLARLTKREKNIFLEGFRQWALQQRGPDGKPWREIFPILDSPLAETEEGNRVSALATVWRKIESYGFAIKLRPIAFTIPRSRLLRDGAAARAVLLEPDGLDRILDSDLDMVKLHDALAASVKQFCRSPA